MTEAPVDVQAWTDSGEMVVLRTRRPDMPRFESADITLRDLSDFIAECERRRFPPESVVYISGLLGDSSMTCKRLTRVGTSPEPL